MAWSPDGETLASASYFGAVRLWDATDGSERTTLTLDHGGDVVAFASECGMLAATGGNASALRLWELQKGRPPKLIFPDPDSVLAGGGGSNQVMALSSDGRLLANGYIGGFGLDVWDVEARKVRFARVTTSHINAVAFSPDGKFLASGSGESFRAIDAVIRLWDVATGDEVGKLEGHERGVLSVSFAPDGKTLASSSYDKTLRIWDVAKKAAVRRFDCDASHVAFSPDGKKLAAYGLHTGKIRFFNPASGELLLEIQDVPGTLTSLAFSPDGKKLAVAGGCSAIRIYDTTTGKPVLPAEGHWDAVTSLAFSPDGKMLASRGGDRTIRLWDLAANKEKRVLSLGPGLFHGNDDGTNGFRRHTIGLAFTPDGRKLASLGGWYGVGDPPFACLWDVASGEQTARLTEPRHAPDTIAMAPDGEAVAELGDNGVHFWSLTGEDLGVLDAAGPPESGAYARCFAFVPDGRSLAGCCDDKTIRLWDWKSHALLRTFPTGDHSFFFIVSSPDGSLLATWGPPPNDGHRGPMPVYLWETATGKLLRKLGDDREGTNSVVFAPDGRRLVVATRKSVDVWDVLTGEELSARDGKPLLAGGHKGAILCAAISPDGKTIASGGADTTILLWNVADLLPKTPATHPTVQDLNRLWDDLRSDDAPTAYKAVLALLGAPEQAAALLKERVPPAPKPDARRVKDLIAKLDDNDFAVREAASRALAALGEAVEPDLRAALAVRPSPEARGRCERLLEAIAKGTLDADGLRRLRAVGVLERLGTADARGVLKGLADGAPGRIRREAKLSLDRMDRRAP